MSQLWLRMANLVFELEKKISFQGQSPSVKRNIDKMKDILAEAGLMVLNPIGETYNETRTELEASIAGTGKGLLVITDVIKPIVYAAKDGTRSLVQKAVVIVGNK